MDENPALRALARFNEPTAAERLTGIFAWADKPAYFSNFVANTASVLDAVKPLTAASRVAEVAEMVSAVAPVAGRTLSARTSPPMLYQKSAWDLYQYGTVPAALASGPPGFKRSPGYFSVRSPSPAHGHGFRSAASLATPGRTTFDISAPAAGLLDQWMPSVTARSGAERGVGFGAAQHAFGYAARPVTRDLHGFVRSPIADLVRSDVRWPGAAGFAGYVQTASRQLQESTEAATRMFSASIADAAKISGPATTAGIGSWAYSGISPATGPHGFRPASGFRHSPAHPRPSPRSPALDSLMDTLRASAESAWASPTLPAGFDFTDAEASELEVIEYPDQVEETEVEDLVAVEAVLLDFGFEEELDHLRGIPDLLAESGHKRVLAASSANIVFQHLADRVFPARKGLFWRDRRGHVYKLDGDKYANRLIAFVGIRLHDEMSDAEYVDFDATVNAVKQWVGRGHHVPVSDEVGEYNHRQFLRVMGLVSHAYRRPLP